MRSSVMPLGPTVSRDRVITSFPKWYTPAACLQLREHFHGQVSAACQHRNTGTVGLKLSKVVVVGDLYVGKTSLIHRFCKNVFDRDYKATIGVDFEMERFEVAGIPFSLQMVDFQTQPCILTYSLVLNQGKQISAAGTQQDRRSSSASRLPTTGVPRVSSRVTATVRPQPCAAGAPREFPAGRTARCPGIPCRHQICPLRATEETRGRSSSSSRAQASLGSHAL
ncbi:ras-related protein Rab-36 isoform X8 [Pseudorca crassidens]|uniref:ras-related protein Rab-36 isoform X8 n=1 Tax=Pseudorca crassidens TaxID=82174 RepID=UPI00352EC314